MEKQLVTFETAKLAKNKGFNLYSNFVYRKNKEVRQVVYYEGTDNNYNEGFVNNFEIDEFQFSDEIFTAPNQLSLESWLLNEHNINIELTFDDGQWAIYVGEFTFPDSSVDCIATVECDNFQDAVRKKIIAREKGLQEALKLI